MNRARKALVAAIIALLATVLTAVATGHVDEAAISTAVTGVITTALVYLTPNDTAERRNPNVRR